METVATDTRREQRMSRPCARDTCHPVDFLAHGAWRSSPATFRGGACSDTTARTYQCSAARTSAHGIEWRNPPSSPCSAVPALSAALINGKVPTLWLIGDSTMAQTAAEAYCRLHDELTALDSSGRSAREWRWKQPRWSWATTAADGRANRMVKCAEAQVRTVRTIPHVKNVPPPAVSNAASRGEMSVAQHHRNTSTDTPSRGPSVRLCFVPSGARDRYVAEGRAASRVHGALQRLIEYNLTHAHDLALMNTGLHYIDRSGTHNQLHMEMVHELIGVVERHQATCPHVLWRETYAQTFPTPDGLFTKAIKEAESILSRVVAESSATAARTILSLATHPAVPERARMWLNTSCEPLPPAISKPVVLSNVSAALHRHPGFTVLDMWTPTRSLTEQRVSPHASLSEGQRASTHTGRAGMPTSNPHQTPLPEDKLLLYDCTHFCSYIGVSRAELDAVAFAAAARRSLVTTPVGARVPSC